VVPLLEDLQVFAVPSFAQNVSVHFLLLLDVSEEVRATFLAMAIPYCYNHLVQFDVGGIVGTLHLACSLPHLATGKLHR